MKRYFIRIYYKDRRIEFFIDSEPINDTETLHKKILDYMGKNDMRVFKHGNNFKSKWEYYLTYEEVVDGSRSRPLQQEEVIRT